MGTFDGAASATDLGVHTLIGGAISCVPDATYPVDPALVRRIRAEIDPAFRPLWVTNWWRSPNGGVVKVGHHMLARHVPHPRYGAPTIRNLLMPTLSYYGIRWTTPILEAYLLDGISDEERQRGMLPRYEPFDERVFWSMKYSMWARNNLRPEERVARTVAAQDATKAAQLKAASEELTYRHQHDGNRLRRRLGLADRAFVSWRHAFTEQPQEAAP